MDAAAWVAVVAAAISLGGIIPAMLQVKSMKQQTQIQQEQTRLQAEIQKDSQRPYVWMDLRPAKRSPGFVELVLKNSGNSMAQNIQVQCEPRIERTASMFLFDEGPEIELFDKGIKSLMPGRALSWGVGRPQDILNEGAVSRHTITISCDGPFGPEVPRTFELDFDQLSEVGADSEGSLRGIQSAIERLKG